MERGAPRVSAMMVMRMMMKTTMMNGQRTMTMNERRPVGPDPMESSTSPSTMPNSMTGSLAGPMSTNLVTEELNHARSEIGEKKAALGPWMVVPITMAATSADPAVGGDCAAAAPSTGTTTAEVSAGHRFPRSL